MTLISSNNGWRCVWLEARRKKPCIVANYGIYDSDTDIQVTGGFPEAKDLEEEILTWFFREYAA